MVDYCLGNFSGFSYTFHWQDYCQLHNIHYCIVVPMLHTIGIQIFMVGVWTLLVGVREVWTLAEIYGDVCDLWGHHIVVSLLHFLYTFPSFSLCFLITHLPSFILNISLSLPFLILT